MARTLTLTKINVNYAARPDFLTLLEAGERGNIVDDVTFITIFLVSFNIQSFDVCYTGYP